MAETWRVQAIISFQSRLSIWQKQYIYRVDSDKRTELILGSCMAVSIGSSINVSKLSLVSYIGCQSSSWRSPAARTNQCFDQWLPRPHITSIFVQLLLDHDISGCVTGIYCCVFFPRDSLRYLYEPEVWNSKYNTNARGETRKILGHPAIRRSGAVKNELCSRIGVTEAFSYGTGNQQQKLFDFNTSIWYAHTQCRLAIQNDDTRQSLTFCAGKAPVFFPPDFSDTYQKRLIGCSTLE